MNDLKEPPLKFPVRMSIKLFIAYLVIVLMGLGVSLNVYFAADKVKNHTANLIDTELEILSELQTVEKHVMLQIQSMYEYYATQQQALYHQSHDANLRKLHSALDRLMALTQAKELEKVQQEHKKAMDIASSLDDNLSSSSTDWDKARDQLALITKIENEISPLLEQLENNLKFRVADQNALVHQELSYVEQSIQGYTLVSILVAFAIGWVLKDYVRQSATSKRLAVFTQRNPNPILGLDANSNVSFVNPACNKLLHEVGYDRDQYTYLIPKNIVKLQDQLKQSGQTHLSVELSLGNKVLSCQLHYLDDLDAYDLHLTDISETKAAQQRLEYLAYHDPQSGIFNLTRFRRDLELHITSTPEEMFAIGHIEIRRFNQLVVTYGMEKSLEITSTLGTHLLSVIKHHDTGKEITLYQTSNQDFALIYKRVDDHRNLLSLHQWLDDSLCRITSFIQQGISIELDYGFGVYPEHGNSSDNLLSNVRMALDRAIQSDSINACIFNNAIREDFEREHLLISELRQAIKQEKLELYLQPQVQAQEQNLVGFEALIRWPREQGFISPAEFIPLAEQSGLIIPLGKWILNQACEKAKALVEEVGDNILVAVNISPHQFRASGFLRDVEQSLMKSKLAPHNLELEITEGVIMYNEEETIDLLGQLKALGVKLSIDDFGTGYSSLAYLKQFPIDKLKIDQSFVRNIHKDKDDQAIVRTVIDLGRNLGLTLIAEGVEEVEQLELLKSMGCDEIQGYYYSKPLPWDAVQEYVKKVEA